MTGHQGVRWVAHIYNTTMQKARQVYCKFKATLDYIKSAEAT